MEMKKQGLTSASHSEFTLEALKQIAPSAFTEVRGADGELTEKVDFDTLRELLGDAIADTDEETFGFNWVGKQAAKRAAAEPTRQTLRPVVEDSVDWDTTENLYIEGDNLEVLKLLQRGYLGKVKMIYIDPPYNTGNDFVYNDDFAMSRDEMDEAMGNLDEDGNRLRQNPNSNPRYHSDWCSMIYSRLLVARTLLANDGVIFISIDDNEVHHLRKICDEVFGAGNFVAEFNWRKKTGANDAKDIAVVTEAILLYAKNHEQTIKAEIWKRDEDSINQSRYNLSDEFVNERGKFYYDTLDRGGLQYSDSLNYGIEAPDGGIIYPNGRDTFVNDGWIWKWGKEKIKWGLDNKFLSFVKSSKSKGSAYTIKYKVYQLVDNEGLVREKSGRAFMNLILNPINQIGNKEMKELFDGGRPFSNPKPVGLIKFLLDIIKPKDSLILDFFSGSATTAHAVMQLNAEDGGKRKYICVQLPEETPEGSEARKAGYDTICEIGKERIRRAGKQIENKMVNTLKLSYQRMYDACGGSIESTNPTAIEYFIKNATQKQIAKFEETSLAFKEMKERMDKLDTGFRVLRVDSSNMEEIYFTPAEVQQHDLFTQVDSVKPDRSELDLLFGCMVDWGVELNYPLRKEEVGGKRLHIVNEGALVACFDKEIGHEAISRIAEMKPLRVIFREDCFATDADKMNIYEKFKQFCGWNDDEVYKRIHVI